MKGRGGGAAGGRKQSEASLAAEHAAMEDPLLLHTKSDADAPPQKYPDRILPQPLPLTQSDREVTERSRFLSETMKYSGYYVVPDPNATQLLNQHSLISSSFAPDSASTAASANSSSSSHPYTTQPQMIYTPTFERYSDRYRKILGKKSFHHEITQPNTHLFPPELLNDRNGRLFRPGHGNTTFTSKVQFLSTKALLSEVSRLVTNTKVTVGQEDGDDTMGDERKTGANGAATGADGPAGNEDGDEENAMQEDEEEQNEDEGDYGENYGDDDEDGGDAFGDDGDEGETM